MRRRSPGQAPRPRAGSADAFDSADSTDAAHDVPGSASQADATVSVDTDEWLDIVDDNDQVVGRARRSVVHAEGHLHRSTHIVIGNSRGEVFVQLRSLAKSNSPGLWDSSAAGHVDSGESYRDCASREIGEELGIAIAAEELQLCGRLDPVERNGLEFTDVYVGFSDESMTLRVGEVDDGRWLTPDEVDTWLAECPEDFTRTFPLVWAMVREAFRGSSTTG
ncbi:MAG: NUDIX hydrolase [Gammaproteobacteria bacterium]|nr:MAG: NUDIX hydrolase [Gammaproteobacteria bacterium]